MKGKKFVIGIALFVMAGCAGNQQQVAKTNFYFPPLPDEPRIEYITYYQNESDITIPSAIDKFFGTEDKGETLDSPVYLVSNAKGIVYVSDLNKDTVTIWDNNKHEVRRLNGEYKAPRGLAIDKTGNLYVGDKDGKIFVFDGATEAQIREMKVDDHVKNPLQMAIDDERGHLIVPNPNGHKVVVFDLEGNFLFEFGKRGAGNCEFNFPVAVAVDKSGRILVADSMNARLERFTPDGKFIDVIGSRGDGFGNFQLVKGVAVDSEGNIYASDGRHKRILIFTDKGEFASMLGDTSSQLDGNGSAVYGQKSFVGKGGKLFIGTFAMPQGICIDKNDNIFIADQMSHLYHQFRYLDTAARQKVMVENKDIIDKMLAKIKGSKSDK
jgi:DNA-binding beta-propeller fold protein YncE